MVKSSFGTLVVRSKFSWALFFLCLAEFVFWSQPVLGLALNPDGEMARVDNDGMAMLIKSEGSLGLKESSPPNTYEKQQDRLENEENEFRTSGQESQYSKLSILQMAGLVSAVAVLTGSGFGAGKSTSRIEESSKSPSPKKVSGKNDGKKQKKNPTKNIPSFPSPLQNNAITACAFGALAVPARRGVRVNRVTTLLKKYALPQTSNRSAVQLRAFSSTRFPINSQASFTASPTNATPTNAAMKVDPSTPVENEPFPTFKEEPLTPTIIKSQPPQKAQKIKSSDFSPEEYAQMSDEVIGQMISDEIVEEHKLEALLGDLERAVRIRRNQLVTKAELDSTALNELPYENYNYEKVQGACCENVLGYVQVPLGIVGPLRLNDQDVYVPMATTEGCLVASTQRGSKAIRLSGGAHSVLVRDGMTRAPLLRWESAVTAGKVKDWLDQPENYKKVEEAFNSTGRFARLQELKPALAGRQMYLRFTSATGDAMGMNMISKGVEAALKIIEEAFPETQIMSLSGNFCTDKKPSAVNWIEGRGKSVVVEATIKQDVVKTLLKTSVDDLVDLNLNKNLIGSIMAGSIGGFNAHASNIVTAIFLATGQDPAQNVESSNCLTTMEKNKDGDLYMSCTMPSIEVGTVGGGTGLPAQSSCLDIMGVKGVSKSKPGSNPAALAANIAATVLAGELSLMSALAAGHLVKSHLALNRK